MLGSETSYDAVQEGFQAIAIAGYSERRCSTKYSVWKFIKQNHSKIIIFH